MTELVVLALCAMVFGGGFATGTLLRGTVPVEERSGDERPPTDH